MAVPDFNFLFAPQPFRPELHGAMQQYQPTGGIMSASASPAQQAVPTAGTPMQPVATPQPAPQAAMSLGSIGARPTPTAAPQQGAMPEQQRYLIGGGLGDYLRGNQGSIFNLAAGLMGGQQGLQQALANMPQAMQGDRDAATRQRQNMAIQNWIGSQDLPPEKAALYEAFPQLAAESAFDIQKAAAGAGSGYGLTPVYGTDVYGNTVIMQMSKNGEIIQSAVPEGVTPMSPGDLYSQRAAGAARGKGQGEAQVNLPQADYSAQVMLSDIDATLNSPGLSSVTGFAEGRIPEWGAWGNRREAISRIDKLKADTFKQAFESLKGGGQITEYESQSAAKALARIQDRTLDDKDYLTALQEFRQTVLDLQQLAHMRAQGLAPPVYGPQNQSGGGGGALPAGVTEDDIQHTMQVHGLTREQVLQGIGGQ